MGLSSGSKKSSKRKRRQRAIIKITSDSVEVWQLGLTVSGIVIDALILLAIFITASWYQ